MLFGIKEIDNMEDSNQREKEKGCTVFLAGRVEDWIPGVELISLIFATYMFI